MQDMKQTETKFEEFKRTINQGIDVNGVRMPYWKYQLIVHKRDLGLYAKGIKITRHFKISHYKEYYGIKGSGEKLLEDFMTNVYNKHITNHDKG